MYHIYQALRMTAVFMLSFAAIISQSTLAKDSDTQSLADQITINYETFKLDNGLTVLLKSDHSTPTVYVGMWYGVGSKDEPEGKSGFAHLFEHLMFQKTENRSDEFFDIYSKAGATGLNGSTAYDRTNYFATVPTGALDFALWIESDRMTYLLGAVDEAAITEQRKVVKNEKRTGQTRPFHDAFQKVMEGIYPKDHPYHHSTIGSMNDLNNASVEDVHNWFKKYNGANNAVLVLVGDVDIATAKEKVTKYFSEAPTGGAIEKVKVWVPHIATTRKDEVYADEPGTLMIRGWAAPTYSDREATLLNMVMSTLVNNKNAPLYKKLVDDLKIVTNLQGSVTAFEIAGTMIIGGKIKPGTTVVEVESVIDDALAEYFVSGPDQDLLDIIKLSSAKGMISSLESKTTVATMLAKGYLYADDPLIEKKKLAWQQEATAEDLRNVARKWLSRHYYQRVVHPLPKLTSTASTLDRKEQPSVGAPQGVQFPDLEKATLKNGTKIVLMKKGDLPIARVSFTFDTGHEAEKKNEQYMARYALGYMKKGTTDYSANELSTAFGKIAISPRFASIGRTSFAAYNVLNTNFAESIALVSHVLRNPSYPQDEFDKMKDNWKIRIERMDKNPSGAMGPIVSRAMYGEDHKDSKIWTKEDVDAISRDNVLSFYEREIRPDNLTVYVMGNLDMATIKKSLKKSLRKWKVKGETKFITPKKGLPAKGQVILVDNPGAPQTEIKALQIIGDYSSDTEFKYSIWSGVFGAGFSSRLNMNLREDKGWAYGANGGVVGSPRQNLSLVVTTNVQTDKTSESMREILKELKGIVGSNPVTKEEFDLLKSTRAAGLSGRFQKGDNFFNSMLESIGKDLPYNHMESYLERLDAVKLGEINIMAKAMIDPSKVTWFIVGDLSKIEDKIRAMDLGDVSVMTVYGERLR